MASNISATNLYAQNFDDEISVAAFAVRQLMAELETMIPVQVIAVTPGSGSPPVAGTVNVQLLLSMLDGNGNAVAPGVVYNLPYFRPQGGPWAIVIDPAVNDYGFIISAYRDISNLVANSPAPGVQNPATRRRYSFSDGIYVGGAFNSVPGAYAWFKPDGTFNITDGNGVVLNSFGGGVPGISITGDLRVSGEVTAGYGQVDNVTLLNHLHVDSNGHFTTKPVGGT